MRTHLHTFPAGTPLELHVATACGIDTQWASMISGVVTRRVLMTDDGTGQAVFPHTDYDRWESWQKLTHDTGHLTFCFVCAHAVGMRGTGRYGTPWATR